MSILENSFTALPETAKEVTAIAQQIEKQQGSTTVLLKKQATKQHLTTHLLKQPFQFVHIATHSLLNYYDHRFSALACYPQPTIQSHLYFSNELQFQDIHADLVVLSSCESGVGQLWIGEGLLALHRSFIYSGAKNVLFSLWKVSDIYSSQLMIDFYKYYLQGMSYTSALRTAKLEMLQHPVGAQPKYWAAFILMGE